MGIPASSLPMMVQGVGIDQNLNAQIPLELKFKDETGQAVRLGQYFREKPVVLALVYYECPGLCDLILNGLSHTMEQISLNVGSDYEVVTVSFNPKETWQLATAKKANYIEKYQRAGRERRLAFPDRRRSLHQEPGRHRGIPLQVRSHQQAVRPRQRHLCADAGRQDRALLLRNRIQAARFPPGAGGSFRQQNWHHRPTRCCCSAITTIPTTGKYGMAITQVTRALGTATVLLLGGFVFIMLRRDRQLASAAPGGPA